MEIYETRLQRLKRYLPAEVAQRILEARWDIRGERKQVTALFCDIVGSTAIIERMDPELALEMVSQILAIMADSVMSYLGMVNRFQGDGMLALFGAPIAHEDDAERAVLAGLMIQRRVAELQSSLQQQYGHQVGVRVGLNTGWAVVGNVGSQSRMEYTAIGDAINLAARMESLCVPGTVLISENTYRFVAPYFELAFAGKATVKGREAPVDIYTVMGEKARQSGLRRLGEARLPLVGRKGEVACLLTAARELLQRQGRLLTLSGDAGVGKSRLLEELRYELDSGEVRWIEAQHASYGGQVSYQTLRQIIAQCAGILPQDTVQDGITRLEFLVHQIVGTKELSFMLVTCLWLAGLPVPVAEISWIELLSPQDLTNQVLQTMRRLLVFLAERQPVVLVCDDLQWVDAASLEVLTQLTSLVRQYPVLMCLTYRLEWESSVALLETIAQAGLGGSHDHLDLHPLQHTESWELLELLLGQRIPAELQMIAEDIVARAGGNPLFLEELVRALIEIRVLVKQEGGWSPGQPLGESTVPVTLQGVLAVRVDRLPEETRDVLQRGSIIGRRFSRPLLAEVVMELNLEHHLHALIEQNLIQVEISEPEPVYSFTHAMMQQVVYTSLLARHRRSLHSQVGQALQRLYIQNEEQILPLLAHHFSQSDDWGQGINYLIRAADGARQGFALLDALGFYDRSLALMDQFLPLAQVGEEEKRRRFRVWAQQERVLDFLGRRVEQEKKLQHMDTLAQELADPLMQAEVAQRRAWLWQNRGDYGASRQAVDLALTLYRRVDSQAGERDAWRQLGHIAIATDTANAPAWYEKALEIDRQLGDVRNEGEDLGSLGLAYFALGCFAESEPYLEGALGLHRSRGNRVGEARELSYLGLLYFQTGNLSKALTYANDALQLRHEIGMLMGQAYSLGSVGEIHMALGRYADALRRYQEAEKIFHQIGDQRGVAISRYYAGLSLAALGDMQQAGTQLAQAIDLAQARQLRSLEIDVLIDAAAVARETEDLAGARAFLQRTEELMGTYHLTRKMTQFSLEYALVELRAGNLIQAYQFSRQALAALEAGQAGQVLPEQVHFVYSLVCQAREEFAEAQQHLELAQRLVAEKARQIEDVVARADFLEHNRLNQKILASGRGQ
ncbi:MAG: tetratricopeptide repeat protein [Chloroflexi bacterium]|nr:tetratricopeptide repeat protein [Chloroflexota bacterium]